MNPSTAYTERELDLLARHYASMGPKKLAKLMPGRTAAAIQAKAQEMGCTKRRGPWSEKEEAIVKANYSAGGLAACERLLPHRSSSAITNRAWRLGLSIGKAKPTRRFAEAARAESADNELDDTPKHIWRPAGTWEHQPHRPAFVAASVFELGVVA